MINKRGQGMSTSTIVLLILAVVVLVVLILGFTMGWGKIAPWISKTNVDDIVNSCEAACSSGGVYSYCTVEKELIDADKNKIKTTCAVFSTVNEFKKYGIRTCSIDCQKPCNQIRINDVVGTTTSSGNDYDVSSLAEEETCYVPRN